ncbi:MAG: AAA family ATPase [Sandaracinaceae bacterium]|nr:MAG: AAA family ATPase [Sandaracinaceae bacterium]HBQ20162.1 ATPase [Myxococcales bacterium]
MLVAAIAGEHMVLIGPPGTAKSALIRLFAKLVDATYFEYLLTRFTEPNEIFGPIDIQAFRTGNYQRRMDGMLPQSEIVFLDEVFKANSAILNSLLSVLNERVYTVGGTVHKTPLISAFGASNEVPNDEDLMAVFDRFLLRVRSENLDSYHFQDLLQRGLTHEVNKLSGTYDRMEPLLTAQSLHDLQVVFAQRMRNFPEDFLSTYKGLVFQIRAEGVSMSDRRAIKLLKLFAASAMLDGRAAPDASDFFILRHIWNNLDQAEILDGIVGPVLEAHYRDHPEARRFGAADVGMDALIAEINRIRELLTGDRPLSDIQLFSQLKALNEIKAALQAIGTQPAQEAIARVDQLLGHVFQSGKFSQ